MTFDPHRVSESEWQLRDDLEGLVELWYTVADSHEELGNMDKYHSYRACADQLAKTLDESE